MPIKTIKVSEYECVRCGYKWINRINGHDGPVPQKCAKCKRLGWNGGEKDLISHEESGLRTRIKGLKKLYYIHNLHWGYRDERDKSGIHWPKGLSEKFLNINPRPTIEELKQVLFPPGGLGLSSQNLFRRRGYILDPEKPGWLKYDKKEYLRILKQEAQNRQKAMIEIMKSRGVDHDE
jgi:hypothetical protein